MNKAVLLRGSLVSAVMAVAMKHAGWGDSGLALLSSAFTLSWLWAACQSHSNGDLLRQAQSRRDQLHHLLTRIAYKLRELPPNVQPLNYGLHEEMWTAVSRPPDTAVTVRRPGHD